MRLAFTALPERAHRLAAAAQQRHLQVVAIVEVGNARNAVFRFHQPLGAGQGLFRVAIDVG